jgi:hypothetical protein
MEGRPPLNALPPIPGSPARATLTPPPPPPGALPKGVTAAPDAHNTAVVWRARIRHCRRYVNLGRWVGLGG